MDGKCPPCVSSCPIPDIFYLRYCHLVATVISNIDVGGANDRTRRFNRTDANDQLLPGVSGAPGRRHPWCRRSTEGWAEALRNRGANMWRPSSVTLSIAPGTGRGRCISQDSNKEFSLTALGACLTSDAHGSRRNYARWSEHPASGNRGVIYIHRIKSGESASDLYAWQGMPGPIASQHPEEQAIFNDAMTGNSRSESRAVLEAYDFSRFSCVADLWRPGPLTERNFACLPICPWESCLPAAPHTSAQQLAH